MPKDIKHISQKTFNNLFTDYRSECIAINLRKYYNVDSNIFLKRKGKDQRPYSKDVKAIDTVFYELNNDYIEITANREGLYDYLPEGLFHSPSLINKRGNIDLIVEQINQIKKVEEHSRDFFQPFELEIFYLQVESLMKEFEFDLSDNLIDFMSELWPLLKEFDYKTAKIILNIFPFLNEIRGKKKWISSFLSSFTEVPVEISYIPNIINGKDMNFSDMLLGNARLGITFIPSGDHKDSDLNWIISYGPIPYNKINDYIDTHSFRKLLNNIYDYLIPITVDIHEKFETNKQEYSFKLTKKENYNILGYSTFI